MNKKQLLAVTAISIFTVAANAQLKQDFPFWDDPRLGGCELLSQVVHATATVRDMGVTYAESMERAKKIKGNEAGIAIVRWVYAHEMEVPSNVTRDFTKKCLNAKAPQML